MLETKPELAVVRARDERRTGAETHRLLSSPISR